MLGITFQAVESVRCQTLEEPRIEASTDAIVAVRLAAICGSDLHVYHGRETGLDPGTVLGHEFVGMIVEVGSDVTGLGVGTPVASPFTTNCGQCAACATGLTARCRLGELFGWREKGRGLHGGQAEFVRVPLAQTTLFEIPPNVSPLAALLAGDVLATGLYCADQGGVGPGKMVGVIGCGPVGLMAILAARHLGAERVLALDRLADRLSLAARFGAEPIDVSLTDARTHVAESTGGEGLDVVLEAVGSGEASRLGFELLRPGGTLSVVGVHTEPHFSFSPVEAYDRNLTYRIGRCPARHYMPRAMALLDEVEMDPTVIVSHRLPLSAGEEGYRMFSRREPGCTKVVLEARPDPRLSDQPPSD